MPNLPAAPTEAIASSALPLVRSRDDAEAACRDLLEDERQGWAKVSDGLEDVLRSAYKLGYVVYQLRQMPREESYGEGHVEWLADRFAKSTGFLYGRGKFYEAIEASGVPFERWLEERDDLRWKSCLKWARRQLSDGEEDEREEQAQEEDELLSLAGDMETNMFELDRAITEHQEKHGETEAVRQAKGVLSAMAEKVDDYRRLIQPHSPKGESAPRVVDEDMLSHVRQYGCLCCDKPGSDPHHIKSGGTAVKAHDALSIPLCRTHHDEYHGSAPDDFYRRHQVDAKMKGWLITLEAAYDLPPYTLLPR